MPSKKVTTGISWNEIRSEVSFSKRKNYVRALLEHPAKVDLIKFSGGFPDEATFPSLKLFSKLLRRAHDDFKDLFQYDATTGFKPLRDIAVDFLHNRGIQVTSDKIHIVTGSQQFLFLVGEALLNPNDYVIVEAPTYLGALKAFDHFKPIYIQVKTDDKGIIISSLIHAIEENIKKGKKPKLIYLIPNFSNPTGVTTSVTRRKKIARIIKQYNIPLIEDDPYRELRYKGDHLPTIFSFAPEHVAYCTTVSKTLAPALRVGIAVASPNLLEITSELKQGIDLNTSKLLQAVTAVYIRDGYLDSHVPTLISLYKPRMEKMLLELNVHFSKARNFRWSKPDGGMFLWMQLPKGFDTEKILPKALETGIAYIPGVSCFANPTEGLNTLRLNFSNQKPKRIEVGIARLAELLLNT